MKVNSLGLRKADVDVKARLLTVAQSYDRDTTKGGHADVIPIAAELVPYVAELGFTHGQGFHIAAITQRGEQRPFGAQLSLGDEARIAMTAAKGAVTHRDLRRSWIFFGDPAMSLKDVPVAGPSLTRAPAAA